VPPFALIRAESIMDDGKTQQRVRLVVKGKDWEVTSGTGKVTETITRPGQDITLADSVSMELWLKKGPSKGDSFATRTLNLDDLNVHNVTSRIRDHKEIVYQGGKVMVYEIESHHLQSKKTVVSLVDEQGHLISKTLYGKYEMRRESESDASNTEYPTDF